MAENNSNTNSEIVSAKQKLLVIDGQLHDIKNQIKRKNEAINDIYRYIDTIEKTIKELEREGVRNNVIKRDILRRFDRLLELLMRRNLHLEDLKGLLQKDLDLRKQGRQILRDANKTDEEEYYGNEETDESNAAWHLREMSLTIAERNAELDAELKTVKHTITFIHGDSDSEDNVNL